MERLHARSSAPNALSARSLVQLLSGAFESYPSTAYSGETPVSRQASLEGQRFGDPEDLRVRISNLIMAVEKERPPARVELRHKIDPLDEIADRLAKAVEAG